MSYATITDNIKEIVERVTAQENERVAKEEAQAREAADRLVKEARERIRIKEQEAMFLRLAPGQTLNPPSRPRA